MKHHYVPVFLIRQWADASGKVTAYRKSAWGISARPYGPRAVCYSDDLFFAEP
ncbi:DUF4238 domain-containing protein [Caulobacter sp. NIBR2454]|uniref:DUF4238 domain-containing protein n=1 Tax=Caulobacter sp. NIBR2454 TaxID=3015996 RepID=UPI003FA47348